MKIPTVLLVEDSEDDAFFFRRTFERSEIECTLQHVVNGADAVDFLRNAFRAEEQSLPQTIFLDLKMPLMNGFEVLEWLNTQPFAGSIQVVVLSGSEQEHDKQRASKLGAAEYVVKPIKVQDLHRVLHHVCPPRTGAHV